VIETEYGRLDVLVNNAGINDPVDGPPSKTSLDAVRRVFDVNVFGVLAVTQAMLPLLRKSGSARIVNMSSTLGSLILHTDPALEFAPVQLTGYNASKAALNMLTVQLAAELRDTGSKVNSAAPGFTATDLNGNTGYQTVTQGAVAPVRLAMLQDDGPTGGFFSANQQEPWQLTRPRHALATERPAAEQDHAHGDVTRRILWRAGPSLSAAVAATDKASNLREAAVRASHARKCAVGAVHPKRSRIRCR
jgi:NAD(P)-dependent dehydrogenase (short-subunit alcohol dehydrogenase family)